MFDSYQQKVWCCYLDDKDTSSEIMLSLPLTEEAFEKTLTIHLPEWAERGLRVTRFQVRQVHDIYPNMRTEDLETFNSILLYCSNFPDDPMFEAFIALAQALEAPIQEIYAIMAFQGYEFFPEVWSEEDIAQILVAENRVFDVKLPDEVKSYLDYSKIGVDILKKDEFFVTDTGIVMILTYKKEKTK